MKSLGSKLIPVAIASILCGVAVAGGGKDDHMKMMDTDGDGKITAVEHANGATTKFTKMDSNQDGRVTAAEMDASHAAMKGKDQMARHEENAADKSQAGKMSSTQKIATMDTNSDGALTAEEHAAGAKKMFSKMDKDRDGMLTAQEMREGHRSEMTATDTE